MQRNGPTRLQSAVLIIVALLTLTGALLGVRWYLVYGTDPAWRVQEQGDALVRAALRYGDKHGHAPETLEDLVAEGFIGHLPKNAFTHSPMRRILPQEPPSKGDYTYLPQPARAGTYASTVPGSFILYIYSDVPTQKGNEKWWMVAESLDDSFQLSDQQWSYIAFSGGKYMLQPGKQSRR